MNRLERIKAYGVAWCSEDDLADLLAVAEAAETIAPRLWDDKADDVVRLKAALAALTEDVYRPRSIRELVDRGK